MRGLIDQRLQKICLNDFDLPDAQFQLKTFACLKITGDFARENIDIFLMKNIKHNVRLMLNLHQCASQYHVTTHIQVNYLYPDFYPLFSCQLFFL